MATHKVSPPLILLAVAALFAVFITSATAEGFDLNSLPNELKTLPAELKDESTKSKIIDQMNAPAGAPKSGDPETTTLAHVLSSVPTPGGGKDKLNSFVQQFGPSTFPDAVKKGDTSVWTNMFKNAPGPDGVDDGAAAALTKLPGDAVSIILNRGSSSGSGSADNQQASPSSEDSASPAHGPSTILGVAMVIGFVLIFLAL